MDPVEGGPLRPPSNEVARAWARAQISRGRSARSELGARGDALVVQMRCPARSTVTLGCQSYRVLRLTGGRSCRMYAYQTEGEEIWPASWRPAEAARSRKGCCARRASLRNLLHSRAPVSWRPSSAQQNPAHLQYTVMTNSTKRQLAKRPLIMPPRRSHRSFPTQPPASAAGPRRQVGYRAQQKNRDKEHGAAATQPWVGRAAGTSARESHSGSMMRRESAPFHHPQNRSSILSHHHAWHLPPTSQAQPDHRRCQALALRWVSYGQMCLIEAALAAQPGQTASRHHRPTSPGHRPISRGLASHHRRRCRQ